MQNETTEGAPLAGGPVDRSVRQGWVRYNNLTETYDTPDGTIVAAELIDNVKCLADVLNVATIREKQRKIAPPNIEVQGRPRSKD